MNKKGLFLVILMALSFAGCSSNISNMTNNNDNFVETTSKESYERNEKKSFDELFVYDTSMPKVLHNKHIFSNIDDYPNVDGSTALIPYMQKLLNSIFEIDEDKTEDYIVCSKTSKAWENLTNKKTDLLIVGEVPESAKEEIVLNQTPILYSQVRNEGLVFIVNKDNPINNISKEDLIRIYTGEITNWKELGGEDKEIKAFQRNESSGSQTNFIKVLMKDIEPKVSQPEYYIGDMGYLVDAIASFDGENNAIGYSVYYYANVMYTKDNLKLLAIDGVLPSNETIGNGTYPLLTKSYVAIRADENESSNTYKLYDYIRSNLGIEDLVSCGYVPVK